VISLNRDSIFRDLAEDGFSQAGLSLTPAYEVAYAGTALALVRVGLGIAILPQCVAAAMYSQWQQRFLGLHRARRRRILTLAARNDPEHSVGQGPL
jgi:DNA-binding transcriptional LysR family regulator